MGSGLGWIDFSSEHRDRVRTVIDLLAAPGVVDELGIGIIRDVFSDVLFPGISTIQTRPKYFLIVPRILKDYENLPDKQRQRISLEDYLAREELDCRVKLAERYGSREGLGVIGVTFGTRTDTDVQRRPSSVYWNGLCTFGLVKANGSLSEFCRRQSGHRPSLRLRLQETKDELGDDVDAEDLTGNLVMLPPLENWKEELSITLTEDEARFLRHQITASKPDSLLGQLLLDDEVADAFTGLTDKADFAKMVDLLEEIRFPHADSLRIARMARDFWKLLYGAHIRYNVLLQSRYGGGAALERVEQMWQEWWEQIREFDWHSWSDEALWVLVAEQGSHPQPWTKKFINGWIDACRRREPSVAVLDELVIHQETLNKRSRSRLQTKKQDEAVGEWVGISVLDYRLKQARVLVTDIQRAERGEADPNAGH